MIIFDRFAIHDMPKTGGFYIRKIFGQLPFYSDDQRRERVLFKHRVFDVPVPKYTFIRSSLSWYTSWISFLRYGSEREISSIWCPIAKTLAEHKMLSPENYLSVCFGENKEMRKLVGEQEYWAQHNHYNHFINWAKSDCSEDLYTWLINYYSPGATPIRHSDLSSAVIALSKKYDQPLVTHRDPYDKISVTRGKVEFSDDWKERLNGMKTLECINVEDI